MHLLAIGDVRLRGTAPMAAYVIHSRHDSGFTHERAVGTR